MLGLAIYGMARPVERQGVTCFARVSLKSRDARHAHPVGLGGTHRRPSSASGFTLFEMVLVLTVMVVIIAVSWPSMNRLYRRHQLEQGAELVRVRMSAARVHAAETGLIYQFRFEPGGQRFLMLPFEQMDAASGANASSAPRAGGKVSSAVHFEAGSFGETGTGVPEEWLSGLPNAAEYSGANWSGPILFYPDGTASGHETGGAAGSPQITLADDRQWQVHLTVRPLTGGVTVSSASTGTLGGSP